MKIKLNTGVTVKLFEPIAYMSNKAFYAYSNSDYKIAIEEHNYYNWYYILLNNDIVCGPTNWEEIAEFFNDLYNRRLKEMETKIITGCCKVYHVYGENGHRQRESFSGSYELPQTKEGALIEVHNSDMTGTNEYTEIEITATTEKECDEILDAQLSDGIFENCRTGKIIATYTGNVLIEKSGNVTLRVRALGK